MLQRSNASESSSRKTTKVGKQVFGNLLAFSNNYLTLVSLEGGKKLAACNVRMRGSGTEAD